MVQAWKIEAHENHNITKLTTEGRRGGSQRVWRNEVGTQALKLKQRSTKLESLQTEEMVLFEALDPFQSCQLTNQEEERLFG